MELDPTSETWYGWVIVAVGVLSIAFHTVVGYSNALFLVAIADDTGWSRMVVSGALSVYALGSGMWMPAIGYLVQAWGPRRLIPLGGIVLMGGLLLVSGIQSPVTLSLAMLFPVALGSVSVGGLVNFAAIQPWFLERRGTALAIAAVGSSLGVLLMPLIQYLILSVSWRGAYRVMAAVAVVLALLHMSVQRQPTLAKSSERETAGQGRSDLGFAAILRTRGFWLIFLGIGTSAFAGDLIMIHHVAYLTDNEFGQASVAVVLEIIGVAGLVGRIGLGWLSDRIGTTRVFALIAACMISAIGFLTLAGETGSPIFLYAFGMAFGSSLGVAAILFARVASDLFGSRNFGRVMGMAYVGGSLGVAAGPAFAGAAFDVTGSYLSSFAVASTVLGFSFACSWLLRHADRRWNRW
jgi:nitrate/nitrite transporter NarK